MEFNSTYVYFEPVTDMIGLWCIAADSVVTIKSELEKGDEHVKGHLVQIKETDPTNSFPFGTTCAGSYELCPFKFVYIDPSFQDMMHEEKVLEWTDLKIGDVIQKVSSGMIRMVTGINSLDTDGHIFAGGWLADKDLKDWEKVED